MKAYVNAIAARLSLRPPQRRSLEILDRIAEIAPLGCWAGSDQVTGWNVAVMPIEWSRNRAWDSIFNLEMGLLKTATRNEVVGGGFHIAISRDVGERRRGMVPEGIRQLKWLVRAKQRHVMCGAGNQLFGRLGHGVSSICQ